MEDEKASALVFHSSIQPDGNIFDCRGDLVDFINLFDPTKSLLLVAESMRDNDIAGFYWFTDMVEKFRETAAGLVEEYMSAMSNRMNEIMKVLTVIATIFIPLTFIVGIYGMNFDPKASPFNMPELEWRYGYPAVLLVMASVVAGMLWYFRRKKWM